MKKSSIFLAFIFAFCGLSAQEVPCNLTEVIEKSGKVLKGEKNYIRTEYEELRLCLQFQYANDRLCLSISTNGDEKLTLDETNVAYVQFDNGEEKIMKPAGGAAIQKDGSTECRFVVAKEDEETFIHQFITGIYFSSKEYPQIDIDELNRYTARKLKERFNCAYTHYRVKK